MKSFIITTASGMQFAYDTETQALALREHTRMYPREAVVSIVESTLVAARATQE